MTRLLIALTLVLAAPAHGYESGCTYVGNVCENGPGHARGRWVAPDDEHRRMWGWTGLAANLPDGVAGLGGIFTLSVFTGETEGGTEKMIDVAGELVPSIIPVDFKLARRLITRPGPLTIGEFTQLPDFSYSLWDWALGNETCPLDEEGGGTTDPKACHTFVTHIGPVNSSHFVPQSRFFYAHYHRLAMQRAQACDFLATRLGAERNRFEEFVLACEQQALVLEAIAHHFLQDAWSVGHMWERWGSPDPSPFRESPLASIAVAGISGVIHGARSVLQPLPPFQGGEVNDAMCAPHPDVQWSGPGQPIPTAGVGDMYLDVLTSERPEQWREFLSCSVASVRQVYDILTSPALGAAGPVDPTLRPIADPSTECFAQRATNRALAAGAALNFTTSGLPVTVGLDALLATYTVATLNVQVAESLLTCVQPPLTAACAILTARLRLDLARVLFELGAWGLVRPDGREAASGALPDLLGSEPNREYVAQSPLASYLDPDLPWPGDDGNPRALAIARERSTKHTPRTGATSSTRRSSRR